MKVLLGITGSVAAILTPKIIQKLQDSNHEIEIVTTPRGLYFFDSAEIGIKVWQDKDEWPEDGYHKKSQIPHIDLGLWADILLIAPLTADTLSDIANGKADKFLTSIVRAWPCEKPIIVAPAMNSRMWEHPITKEHLLTIERWFLFTVVEPIEKELACGEFGIGAMAKIDDIVKAVNCCERAPF